MMFISAVGMLSALGNNLDETADNLRRGVAWRPACSQANSG